MMKQINLKQNLKYETKHPVLNAYFILYILFFPHIYVHTNTY